MKQRRLLAPLIAALSVSLAAPANAAGISLTDPTGDANWLQLTEVPFSYAPADITKTTISTVFKKVGRRKVATAVRATLTLAEAPFGDTTFWYVVGGTATSPAHDDVLGAYDCSILEFNLRKNVDGSLVSELGLCDPDGELGPKSAYVKVPAKVSGKTISWTVPLSTLKARGIKVGVSLSDFYSLVYFYQGVPDTPAALGFPLVDSAESTLTYRIGK